MTSLYSAFVTTRHIRSNFKLQISTTIFSSFWWYSSSEVKRTCKLPHQKWLSNQHLGVCHHLMIYLSVLLRQFSALPFTLGASCFLYCLHLCLESLPPLSILVHPLHRRLHEPLFLSLTALTTRWLLHIWVFSWPYTSENVGSEILVSYSVSHNRTMFQLDLSPKLFRFDSSSLTRAET